MAYITIDTDGQTILSVSANDPGGGIDIGDTWPGINKNNCYWNGSEIVVYTTAELLQRYKDKCLEEIQRMGFEVLTQYSNTVLYVDFKEARGDTIGTGLATARTDNRENYIVGVDWLRDIATNIRNATDIATVKEQYDLVVAKYNAKREVVI